MGWDTQINIIVENIDNEENQIASELFLTDAKPYWGNGVFYVKYRNCSDGKKILFFTYERRKYLPYWSIQEVSEKNQGKYFTVVASSPDFLCGPAGIVKFLNGEIIDSYGFFERFGDGENMSSFLENPDAEVLYQIFGKDKIEEKIRELYIETNPKKWVEEAYCDNMINFTVEQQKEVLEFANKEYNTDWKEITIG